MGSVCIRTADAEADDNLGPLPPVARYKLEDAGPPPKADGAAAVPHGPGWLEGLGACRCSRSEQGEEDPLELRRVAPKVRARHPTEHPPHGVDPASEVAVDIPGGQPARPPRWGPPKGAAAPPTPSAPVTLHVYDVGTSGVSRMVNGLLRPLGAALVHCGVEVYGNEWSYSDCEGTKKRMVHGVFCSRPSLCAGHSYNGSVSMGRTSMSQEEVWQLLQLLKSYWPVTAYDTIHHNCCHFCDELCQRLFVGPIPAWVMNLAGAGAAIAATGDTTCCRQMCHQVIGSSGDTMCCAALARGGDAVLYHL